MGAIPYPGTIPLTEWGTFPLIATYMGLQSEVQIAVFNNAGNIRFTSEKITAAMISGMAEELRPTWNKYHRRDYVFVGDHVNEFADAINEFEYDGWMLWINYGGYNGEGSEAILFHYIDTDTICEAKEVEAKTVNWTFTPQHSACSYKPKARFSVTTVGFNPSVGAATGMVYSKTKNWNQYNIVLTSPLYEIVANTRTSADGQLNGIRKTNIYLL